MTWVMFAVLVGAVWVVGVVWIVTQHLSIEHRDRSEREEYMLDLIHRLTSATVSRDTLREAVAYLQAQRIRNQ